MYGDFAAQRSWTTALYTTLCINTVYISRQILSMDIPCCIVALYDCTECIFLFCHILH